MKLILPIYAALLGVIAQTASAQMEEVIVTAQKREQSLQDVPISVTAVSGDRISIAEITGVDDLALQTPNFSMSQFNIGEPQYFIRGIGNTLDSAAADSAVSVYLDEVYLGRTGASSSDLYDLDRIEVLRGPQGTLFGRNVVGGAVSILTQKPTDEFEAKVGVTVGDYGLTVLRGYLNGPIGDNIAGKISVSKRDRDGYVDNVLDDREYMDKDNFSARGQLLFSASDTLDMLFGLDYSEDDEAGNCRNVNNLDLSDPIGIAFLYPPVIEETTGGDIRKCASSQEAYQEREVFGSLLRVEWELDFATLTSITAYREMEYDWAEDLAAMPQGQTPFNLVDTAYEESDQVSQELRLSSGDDDNLHWLAGAFYMEENIDRTERFVGELGPPLNAGSAILLDGDISFNQKAATTSWAIFGQIDYEFNKQWSITLGSRYSYDEKDIDQSLLNFEDPAFDTAVLAAALGIPNAAIEALFAPEDAVVLGIPANAPGNLGEFAATGDVSLLNFPYATSANDDWDELTSSASLNWRYDDSGLIYLAVSQGYKSGAFVSSTTTASAAETPLEPELATNYELGFKSQFLDDRLRINASIFQMDYEDLQVFRLVGSLLVGANAEATSKGLELDVTALLTHRWVLNASYAYLDAQYDTYEDGVNDFSGNNLSRSPENSFFIRSSYSVPLADGSELDFVASYSWQDDMYFDGANTAASLEDAYGTINASLTWFSADESWNVAAWGKNLNNEEYRIHSITSNIAGTVDLWNEPRTYGVTVDYSF